MRRYKFSILLGLIGVALVVTWLVIDPLQALAVFGITAGVTAVALLICAAIYEWAP